MAHNRTDETATREIGEVVAIGGSQCSVRLDRPSGPDGVTVGSFLGVRTRGSTVVGVVTTLTREKPDAGSASAALCTFDILGEIRPDAAGVPAYQRGVTIYPVLGEAATALTGDELRLVFAVPNHRAVRIGSLRQDETVGAYVKVDDLLTKHFAILGSTGVGKSSGVAVIVGQLIQARSDLRVFFIDPHNEYGSSFASQAEVLNPRNLKLPFWLFNFEEFVDVLFRGRPGLEEETAILAELLPLAKAMAAAPTTSADRSPLRRADARAAGYNADTPVPYRLSDLIALVEEGRGKLDNRSQITAYSRLLGRIETVRNDARYAFMFENANVGGDTMAEVLGQLFRMPSGGKPMTVMQLAGFPAEVVDSVVSVLCRMAFDVGLWSDGAVPMLVLCEEAHRYAPADRATGFGPTRKAISRIAKEGRKYGVYLGLVTQRPAELDPTIVSQCSTVFAMRLANDRDQAILRAAVSEAAANLIGFVPALGTREVFAFGEGVPLPTRLRFSELPPERVPRGEAIHQDRVVAREPDRAFLSSVVERWRGSGAPRPVPAVDLPALPSRTVPAALLPQAGETLPRATARLPLDVSPGVDAFGARRFGVRGPR